MGEVGIADCLAVQTERYEFFVKLTIILEEFVVEFILWLFRGFFFNRGN
jgi:hypothetical protein